VSFALGTSITALIAANTLALSAWVTNVAIDTAPVLTGEGVASGILRVDRSVPGVIDEALRKHITALIVELGLLGVSLLTFNNFFNFGSRLFYSKDNLLFGSCSSGHKNIGLCIIRLDFEGRCVKINSSFDFSSHSTVRKSVDATSTREFATIKAVAIKATGVVASIEKALGRRPCVAAVC
jgi:hypothetical protein